MRVAHVGIGGVAVEALRSNFNLNGSNHRRTDHGRIVDQPESTQGHKQRHSGPRRHCPGC